MHKSLCFYNANRVYIANFKPKSGVLSICRTRPVILSEIMVFIRLEGNENEEQYGECQQGRSAIAYERKRNPDDRHDAHCHSYIDEQMHEYAAGDAISIDSGVLVNASLLFSAEMTILAIMNT